MSESTQDERLLSLEESVRKLAASTERVAVSQEILADQVAKGFANIAETSKQISEKHDDLSARLKPIEESEAKKLRRREFAKKLAIPGLGATAGVFGARFGNEIIGLIQKLFG